MTAGDWTLKNPPALTREDMRDPALVDELGGSAMLHAAAKAGRTFATVAELEAAGYDPATRRLKPPPGRSYDAATGKIVLNSPPPAQ